MNEGKDNRILYELVDKDGELNCPGCSFQTPHLYYLSSEDAIEDMQRVKEGGQPQSGLCAECIAPALIQGSFYLE